MNNKDVINYLLTSAKKVHMNTIRIWGGGVYESDDFYKVIYYIYFTIYINK
jgi:beta-galactosidase/beta-glucuronidase